MYSYPVKIDLTYPLNNHKVLTIKFQCDLDPYSHLQGESYPIALFSEEDILFSENEDNEGLKKFLLKVIPLDAFEHLSQKALILASDQKLSR